MAKVTLNTLIKYKESGNAFSSVAVHDATFASLCDASGISLALIGDSIGMTVQGHPNTVNVKKEDILYHAKAVYRANTNMFRVLDMPFLSYSSEKDALKTARLFMQDGYAECVKLEVTEKHEDIIKSLADNSIPTCAHLGLLPQTIHSISKYRTFGKTYKEKDILLKNAELFEKAGARIILLECVDEDTAKEITDLVKIPVIGIGSGNKTDGQILVLYDILGASKYLPRFAKDFLKKQGSIKNALSAYNDEVKKRAFPY